MPPVVRAAPVRRGLDDLGGQRRVLEDDVARDGRAIGIDGIAEFDPVADVLIARSVASPLSPRPRELGSPA
jgi:hypothetical protein